jgi:hypothetical protein
MVELRSRLVFDFVQFGKPIDFVLSIHGHRALPFSRAASLDSR